MIAFAVLVAATGCSSTTITPLALGPRAPERHLSLEGPVNFRDLGGYRTTDGRLVRRGVLFRADSLDLLTDADVSRLSDLGIRMAYDLRAANERAAVISRAASYKVHPLPIDFPDLDPDRLRGRILSGALQAAESRDLLVQANRSYVTEHRTQYGELLSSLADPTGLPAVFYCAQGKDRTGVASALVLRALGVPVETILEDYLLTNQYRDRTRRLTERLVYWASLTRVEPDEIRPLLEARAEYLQAAFAAIDESYGSFDAYLEEGLGMDSTELAHLRENLLEPSTQVILATGTTTSGTANAVGATAAADLAAQPLASATGPAAR